METYEVHSLRVTNSVFINYSYIIVDKQSKKAAIIDPSWEFETITDKINELCVDLKLILLTHSHFDHVNLVSKIQTYYDAEVYMHQREIIDYKYICKKLNAFENFTVIALGKTIIQSIWTPGHTTGGSCFLLGSDIFTGDTLFNEGVGVCIPEYQGCAKKLFFSTKQLKSILQNDTFVYPGHSFLSPPGKKFKELLKINIYLHFDALEDFEMFRMRESHLSLFRFV